MNLKNLSNKPKKQSFTIVGELPSMNEIIAVAKQRNKYGKGAGAEYASMKKSYTDLVAYSCAGLQGNPGKNDILIKWYCKNRKKDPDNIQAGIKFILDGMVKGGVIEGDGWSAINKIQHNMYIDKKNPRIEVEIYWEGIIIEREEVY